MTDLTTRRRSDGTTELCPLSGMIDDDVYDPFGSTALIAQKRQGRTLYATEDDLHVGRV